MSEFQNLPLPAIRDAQDYPRVVPAGDSVEIPVIGEFVYCKFSDGDIRVVINGKSTRMESGDERRSGEGTVFRGVELVNDTDVDKSVIFVIGFGKFDRKIITGEVTTVTGVRAADGTFVADTRYEVDAFISPVYGDTSGQVARGFVYGETDAAPDCRNMWASDGTIKVFDSDQFGRKIYVFDFDLNVLEIVDTGAFTHICDDVENGGYAGLRSGQNGLWKYDTVSESMTLLFSMPSDVNRIIAGKNEYLALSGSNPLIGRFYSPEGVLRKTVDFNEIVGTTYTNSSGAYTFDAVGDQWVFFKGNTNGPNEIVYFDYDLTKVNNSFAGRFMDDLAPVSSNVSSDELIVIGGVGYFYSIANSKLYKAQFEALDYSFRGVAFSAGCENDLYKPESNSPVVTANVAVSEQSGRLVATGEIIKAVLQLYFNANIAENYMDSVFSVEIFNTGGREVTKSAGGRGESMAALGIKDDFRAVFPGRVRLLVDTRLETSERV